MMSIYGIIAGVKRFQTLLWIAVACAALADGQPFSRYETIINRKPFGPEPANFDPDAAPGSESAVAAGEDGEMTPEQRSAEEQQLAASVRVSILNVTPAGVVKVGFTDSTAKPPENYYLKVGASQNGWTVKAADPSAESVTLEKGGVEVTVKLGESSGGGGKGGKAAAKPAAQQRRMLPQMMGGGGLARLRMQRMEQEKMRLEAEEKRKKAEAAAKAEQEEREQKAAEEKQALAEERAQQREALLQIQEQLRKQREEREARRAQQGQDNDEDNDT